MTENDTLALYDYFCVLASKYLFWNKYSGFEQMEGLCHEGSLPSIDITGDEIERIQPLCIEHETSEMHIETA